MAMITGTTGNDYFHAGSNPATTNENDTIYLYTGDDTLEALGGDDRIIIEGGDKTISLGDGADIVQANVSGYLGLNLTGSSGAKNVFVNYYQNSAGTPYTNNVVFSGNGNDTVNILGEGPGSYNLGDGDNFMRLNYGSATITTGVGNDYIASDVFGINNDDITVSAGVGNNTVVLSAGDDQITTGSGNDTIITGAGDNTVSSGGGSDTITSGAGSDSIDAGEGDNIYYYDGGADTLTMGAGYDVVTMVMSPQSSGSLNVAMGAGGGSVTLNTSIQLTLTSGGVDDVVINHLSYFTSLTPSSIQTGSGDDTVNDLAGGVANLGEGDNFYSNYGSVASNVTTGAGSDTIMASSVGTSSSTDGWVVNAGAGANKVYLGRADDSVTSGAGADSIFSTGGDDTISSGGGADTITLNANYDNSHSINGGEGDNIITLDPGADTVVVGAGSDLIKFGVGYSISDLDLTLGWGNDTVSLANASNAVIRGGAQGDKLITVATLDDVQLGGGADTVVTNGFSADGGLVWLGEGADLLTIYGAPSSGIGSLYGAGGDDVMRFQGLSSGASLFMNGAEGNDVLVTSNGNDSLTGGPGMDTLTASWGADTVNGAQGDDLVYLNSSTWTSQDDSASDLFYFQSFSTSNHDTVYGAAGDRFDIPAIAYTVAQPEAGTFVLTFDANNVLTIKGITNLADVILF